MSAQPAPNLLASLKAWRDERPNDTFVVDYEVKSKSDSDHLTPRSTVTVGEVWTKVVCLAASMQKNGIQPGDIVAVQLPTWHEYLVAHLAAYAIGAITMPISPIYRTRDVEKQLRLADASAIVVAANHGNFDYVEMALSLKSAIASVRMVVVVGHGLKRHDVLGWDELIQDGNSNALQKQRSLIEESRSVCPARDLMLVNFSSGTTGEPKGVMHSTASVEAAMSSMISRMGLISTDSIIIPVTLGHAAGFLNGIYLPLLLRAKVVYLDRWSPDAVLELVARERITYGPMMPTHLFDLANHPGFEKANIASWRIARVSGGPIARRVVAALQSRLPTLKLCPGWGFSEVLYASCCSPDDPLEKRNESDGRPLDGYQIEVRDTTCTNVLPIGEDGEVVIKTPSQMLGYFRRPELTASSFTADGWLKSGDLGHFDDDGYLTMIGRSKDLIIRGGENVPAVEIEHLLMEHPKVAAAIVLGVPDARLGEKVCAVVHLKNCDDVLSFKDMQDYLVDRRLTKQFVPEYLVILDDMPTTSLGKIKKQQLREQVLPKLQLA